MKNKKIQLFLITIGIFLIGILVCQRSVAVSENKYKKITHENIDLFKTIEKDDDIEAIYQKVGLPDKDLGSGVYILEYNIGSGGIVTIHNWGKGTTKIIYKNGEKIIKILD
jgi:hypothetical protein